MSKAITIDELIEVLKGSYSHGEQEQAIQQLVSLKSNAVEALIATLNSNHGRQSWLAAKALARIEDSRVVPALISSLSILNRSLQGMIIELIGSLQDKRAVLPLIKILNGEDVILQLASIQSLRKIGDTRAVKALLTNLKKTESSSIRYTIIETLGDLGDSQVIEPIRRYKDDENHHVRRRVERALEKLSLYSTD